MRSWLHVGPPGSEVSALVVGPDGDVYFELAGRVWRVGERGAAEKVAELGDGKLIAIEDDGLLCRFGDVIALVTRDGARHDVRRLEPSPLAVVACPEYVAWACERGVWRWWRDGRGEASYLGDHRRPQPGKVVMALRPSRRERARIAPDFVVASSRRLGIVDADELEWLVTLAFGEISLVACRAEAIAYASDKTLGYYDLDADTNKSAARFSLAVSALAMWNDAVAVYDSMGTLFMVDVHTGRHERLERPHRLGTSWPDAKIVCAHGQIYVAHSDESNVGLWSRPGVTYEETGGLLQVYRFGADGAGSHVSLEHDGRWWTHGERGRLPDEATRELLAWVQSPPSRNSDARPKLGGTAVGLASAGWWAPFGERGVVADAIRELEQILAPHVPGVIG